MPGQVLVRKKMLGGDPVMLRGQELSRDGDKVTVKIDKQFYPIVVASEDVIPGTKVFAATRPGVRPVIIQRQMPTSLNALGNRKA